jgi:hypothetical protein
MMKRVGSEEFLTHLDYDWEAAQEKTFLRWANRYFAKADPPVKVKCMEDFQSGYLLLVLLELLTNDKFFKNDEQRMKAQRHNRFQYLENCSHAFNIAEEHGLHLAGVGPEDIVDGKRKLLTGALWGIIKHFQLVSRGRGTVITPALKRSKIRSTAANRIFLEEQAKPDSPKIDRHAAILDYQTEQGKKELLGWMNKRITKSPYNHYEVQNFCKDLRDGTAFCALLDTMNKSLHVKPEYYTGKRVPKHNAEKCLKVCRELGIPRLVDIEDICTREPNPNAMVVFLAVIREHEDMAKQALIKQMGDANVTYVSESESSEEERPLPPKPKSVGAVATKARVLTPREKKLDSELRDAKKERRKAEDALKKAKSEEKETLSANFDRAQARESYLKTELERLRLQEERKRLTEMRKQKERRSKAGSRKSKRGSRVIEKGTIKPITRFSRGGCFVCEAKRTAFNEDGRKDNIVVRMYLPNKHYTIGAPISVKTVVTKASTEVTNVAVAKELHAFIEVSKKKSREMFSLERVPMESITDAHKVIWTWSIPEEVPETTEGVRHRFGINIHSRESDDRVLKFRCPIENLAKS